MNLSKNRLLLSYLNNIYSYNVDSWVLIFLLRAFYIKIYVIYILPPPARAKHVMCTHWWTCCSAQSQAEPELCAGLCSRVGAPARARPQRPHPLQPCARPSPAQCHRRRSSSGPATRSSAESAGEAWLPKHPAELTWVIRNYVLKLENVFSTFVFQLWRKIISAASQKKPQTHINSNTIFHHARL